MMHFCRQKISAIFTETCANHVYEIFPGSQRLVTRTTPIPIFLATLSGYFLTRLFRQLLGLERLRQNDEFEAFIFE